MSTPLPPAWRFGPFSFEPRKRRLCRGGEAVDLPPKAAELLQLLIEGRAGGVDKAQIFHALWPDTAVQESNLTQTIYVLRKALGDAKETGEYIQTLPRRGYRFVADVTEQAPAALAEAESPIATPAPARGRAWRWPALVLGLAAIAGTSVWVRRPRAAAPSSAAAVPLQPLAAPRRSVAVLALRNAAARPEAAWLSTALAEMLSTELGAHPRLRAIAGETVSRTRVELRLDDADALAPDTLRRLRERLGADLVVSGAYLMVGEGKERKLRIDLRVQETASGETLASLAQTGTDEEVLELAARLGARVLETVNGTASNPAAGVEPGGLPENAEALRLYAEGLERLRAFDAATARERLEKAAGLSPGSPLVRLALSRAWRALGHDLRARESAQEADRLAQGLSPEQRLVIQAHRHAAANEWEQAAELYASLTRLFPDEIEHVLRSEEAQTRAGRPGDALAAVARARQAPGIDGGDPRLALAEADAHAALGEHDKEAEASIRARDQARARGARHLEAAALGAEAWALRNAGRTADAERASEKARAIFAAAGDRNSEAWALNITATVRYDLGRYDEALALFEKCLALRRGAGHVRGVAMAQNNLATVLMERGRLDEARALYAQATAVFAEIGDRRAEAVSRFNVAKILLDEGQVEDARQAYAQALALARQAADRSYESLILLDLARVALAQARLSDAADLLEQTVQAAAATHNALVERAAFLTRFDLLLARGDRASAHRVAEELRHLQQESGNENGVREAELALAHVLVDEGQPAEAERLARRAYDHWTRSGDELQAGAAAQHLARALWALGRREEARRLFEATLRAVWRAGLRPRYAEVRADKARLEGLAGVGTATATLQELLAEAHQRGWERIALQTALALGEVEMRQESAQGRARLASLMEEASQKGFAGLAADAERVLGDARRAPTASR